MTADARLDAVRALAESWVGFDDSHHYGDAVLRALLLDVDDDTLPCDECGADVTEFCRPDCPTDPYPTADRERDAAQFAEDEIALAVAATELIHSTAAALNSSSEQLSS